MDTLRIDTLAMVLPSNAGQQGCNMLLQPANSKVATCLDGYLSYGAYRDRLPPDMLIGIGVIQVLASTR